ncbi:MAG: hypothetical protein ACTSWN_08950 [Promethearchaeota archaeon]
MILKIRNPEKRPVWLYSSALLFIGASLLEQGKYVLVAIIVNTSLESLSILLHDFVAEFENLFKGVLSDWHGSTDVFQPANALVKKVFDLKNK